MRKLILFGLWLILFYGCTISQPKEEVEKPTLSGREVVLQALEPKAEQTRARSCFGGVITTALSSSSLNPVHPLKRLDPEEEANKDRIFNIKLHGGTEVGGLFFEYDDGTVLPKPLLIASFGFLQDRWGTEAVKFYELYLEDPVQRIPAHVLILDHPTSGPFLANNTHLSMGSYDDARMWIEIAQSLRNILDITTIHLFGVSMSGQTVVHALIEDKRLGLGLFDSGIAVSIAPDFQQSPGKQLARLETPEGVENPWRHSKEDLHNETLTDKIQSHAIWLLIDEQFIPSYRWIRPEDEEFEIKPKDVAVFLRQAYEDRITFLREQHLIPDTWNHKDFSLENLELFMFTTRIAGVADRVQAPLVLVSSEDDPAVESWMFVEVLEAAEDNPWIVSYETERGGHFGFDIAYGKDYLGKIIRLMLDSEVISNWK
jgi:pimeloyl-ACP methyl ester carboxylesterase